MKEQHSLDNMDSLLFQFAVKTRQLSQKKNEIQQQIKVCRTCITEKRSYIETIQGYIKNLEEEARVKESTVTKNKEKAKRMKATNSLLLQYEQTLKAELESRKNSYNHDQEVYEDRIASCRRTLQSHKETYFQNPVAQKLLLVQAEIEETESRIKDYDDCIMMKQKELEHLAGPTVTSYAIEKLPDSVLGQQPTTEEEQYELTKEDCSINISAIDLNQAASGHEPAVEADTEEMNEENEVQDPTSYLTTAPDKTNDELWSHQQLDDECPPDELHSEAEDPEISQDKQVQLPTLPGPEDVPKVDLKDKAPDAEDHKGACDFPQKSQEANLQSLSTKETSVTSTPTFTFNFSPTSSPRRGTSDSKSPAFVLNLNSNVSTPGFSGFGFDMGSSQEEESSFAFSGSFFNEKKATDAKSSSCTEFLFDHPEQSEDFQFAFTTKSPKSAKENSKDEFPFSFNF
ncbi:uncharacterized protein LOC124871366 isoform X2 [Girardinichthys multiradiatus]|uniref:uncharacterized protein LOC124871366 isoform X2 n=1 Tax=Girardinichthys multiradiatus TaxID=208333 RepID=UPI001FADB5B9|nr:uncharacterized protein LOC124871366 isoform X2 [Girardinichthys multiradiatus]